MKNESDEAHSEASHEFTERYGLMGEGLEEEDQSDKPYRTMHFMHEVPELAEIDRLWSARNRELEAYREKCRLEAMGLFTKWAPWLND